MLNRKRFFAQLPNSENSFFGSIGIYEITVFVPLNICMAVYERWRKNGKINSSICHFIKVCYNYLEICDINQKKQYVI